MKKILVLLGCIVSSCVLAQGNFKFVEESHDFGKVPEGDSVSYEFEFTNTGDQPLKITNVQPSCGCTVPKWPVEAIAPGAKGKILARYATKGRVGPFTKYLTISSDAIESSKQIKFVGEVLPSQAAVVDSQKTVGAPAPANEKKTAQNNKSGQKTATKKKVSTTTTKKSSGVQKKAAPKK